MSGSIPSSSRCSTSPTIDLFAVESRRLGPPVDRDTRDSVTLDLMIHDLDVLLALVDGDVDRVSAMSARDSR